MQRLNQPDVDAHKQLFPKLDSLGFTEEEEEQGVPGIYNRYEITVVEEGFSEEDCGKTELLNMTTRLARAFGSHIDQTHADSIGQWNRNLMNFCHALGSERKIIASVCDTEPLIEEPDEVYELMYRFDSKDEFAAVCQRSLDNLYDEPDEEDWPESFWEKVEDFSDDLDVVLVERAKPLSLLVPDLRCVVFFEPDKTLVLYILKGQAASALELLTEAVTASGLFIREENEWEDEDE